MNLTVNGKEQTIAGNGPVSISALLKELKAENPLYITVELNGEFIEQRDFDGISIKNGDSVEFLYFMGGGRSRC